MTLGCKDIGVRKFEFVAKTQFLCSRNFLYLSIENNLGKQETHNEFNF